MRSDRQLLQAVIDWFLSVETSPWFTDEDRQLFAEIQTRLKDLNF